MGQKVVGTCHHGPSLLVLFRFHSKNLSCCFPFLIIVFACLLFSLVELRNTGRLSSKVNSERGHWPELILDRKLWALAIMALVGGHRSWTLGFLYYFVLFYRVHVLLLSFSFSRCRCLMLIVTGITYPLGSIQT